jgi:hypothetical protein
MSILIYVKVIGIIFSLTGTVLIAIRVTKILRALTFAVEMLDNNHQIQTERKKAHHIMPNLNIVGIGASVLSAEKKVGKLLILGFILQIIGGICQAAALLIP